MISEVAELLRAARAVGFLVGAGISVSAGYPDFRSKDGVYARTAHMNLPYPEAIFDIRHFRKRPQDFFSAAAFLAHKPSKPTPTHSFLRAVQDHQQLEVVVTQNIDGLERQAGISPSKLVEVHGSSASSSCIDCREPFDNPKMRRLLRKGEVARCKKCGGLAKPDVVFFGEQVQINKARLLQHLVKCDLFFIIGTSLQVQPAASIYLHTQPHAPRVVISKTVPESFEARPQDHIIEGDCDEVCTKLASAQGWSLS